MRKYIRLEQHDIEFAINQELKRIGCRMKENHGKWKLIKADQAGEKDGIAFECEVDNYEEESKEECPRQAEPVASRNNKSSLFTASSTTTTATTKPKSR